jgi:hypothetical protein
LPHHSGGGGPAIQTIQTFWANLPNLILAKPYYEDMSKIPELFFIKDIKMVFQKIPGVYHINLYLSNHQTRR